MKESTNFLHEALNQSLLYLKINLKHKSLRRINQKGESLYETFTVYQIQQNYKDIFLLLKNCSLRSINPS